MANASVGNMKHDCYSALQGEATCELYSHVIVRNFSGFSSFVSSGEICDLYKLFSLVFVKTLAAPSRERLRLNILTRQFVFYEDLPSLRTWEFRFRVVMRPCEAK